MQSQFHFSWNSLNKVQLHPLKPIGRHCQGWFSASDLSVFNKASLFLLEVAVWGTFATLITRENLFITLVYFRSCDCFQSKQTKRRKSGADCGGSLQQHPAEGKDKPTAWTLSRLHHESGFEDLKTVGRLRENCKWKNRRHNGLGYGAGHQ